MSVSPVFRISGTDFRLNKSVYSRLQKCVESKLSDSLGLGHVSLAFKTRSVSSDLEKQIIIPCGIFGSLFFFSFSFLLKKIICEVFSHKCY